MVKRRPIQSPDVPAKKAPTKAPPVKTDTTAPLRIKVQRLQETSEGDWIAYTSFAPGDAKVDTNEAEETTPPITPRS